MVDGGVSLTKNGKRTGGRVTGALNFANEA